MTNRRSTRSIIRSDGFSRFLKPGALALIRESRINNSRSHRFVDLSQISLNKDDGSQTGTTQMTMMVRIDGSPCFTGRLYAASPRFFQRKKLFASKSVYFVPSSPVLDLPDSFSSAADIVVSH